MSPTVADLSISAESKQYVRVPIADVAGANPTGDTVEMAFPLIGQEPVTFYLGSWQTISGVFYARCLVGPSSSGPVLTVGYYDVYVRITDDPEVPVLYAGTLEVI